MNLEQHLANFDKAKYPTRTKLSESSFAMYRAFSRHRSPDNSGRSYLDVLYPETNPSLIEQGRKGGRKKSLSLEERERISKLPKEWSLKQRIQKTGHRVRTLVRWGGWTIKPHKQGRPDKEEEKRIIESYDECKGYILRISRKVGIYSTYVKKILVKNNKPTRGAGRPGKLQT